MKTKSYLKGGKWIVEEQVNISKDEKDLLLHAYRNKYSAYPGSKQNRVCSGLVDKGLMAKYQNPGIYSAYYVTELGQQLVDVMMKCWSRTND